MSRNITFTVQPGGCLKGRVRVPGDKSISHRVIMFGALANGESHASGFLQSEDTRATMSAFQQMGVRISADDLGNVYIHGVGLRGLSAPQQPLDLGNSGTSARLMSGLLAGQAFSSEIIGDASLTRRPMDRVVLPLRQMGANIETSAAGTLPMKIQGQALTGIDYTLPVASAQLKSCLLLAGLYADGETVIHEPTATRDHTERMLSACGYPVQIIDGTLRLRGGTELQPFDIQIPADISSAAFFLVGASIAPESDLLIEAVGINPTRSAVVDILRLMGAQIDIRNKRLLGGEPVADLHIGAARLRGIDIPPALVSIAIDEFPAIMVAAACADGRTLLSGAEELRYKESDRIESVAAGLRVLGITVETSPDGMIVEGGKLQGGEVISQGDHRISMAFAMAGLAASGQVVIKDCANVGTSYPGFAESAQQLGLEIEVRE
ncbi:MAG: 3-phosphoshikimate 1-carboxyvinyltransferase [Gammaproteobacteria bacterium]